MSSTPNLLRPSPLKQGDKVAVVAPASPFDREAMLRGVRRIEGWGYQVQYREDIFSRKRYLAGSDERRFEELFQALNDPAIKAVFAARGGYGSQRLLPMLDAAAPPSQPKILLGYSDLSSLLIYAMQTWNWVTFHGPVVAKDIGDRMENSGEASLLRVLQDPRPLGKISPPSACCLQGGEAEAPLVGGCLSLITCTLGTPYRLATSGKILYLEDVGEILYSLDRMLTHLRLAGVFNGVKGLVFGPLKDAHDEPEVIKAMLQDVLGDLQIPMLFGFPSGHIEDSLTVPFGLKVRLNASEGSVEFLEEALANT